MFPSHPGCESLIEPGIRRVLVFTFFFFSCCIIMAQTSNPKTEWRPFTWQNEKSLVSESRGWKAVVSLERGRLMHFGPADRDLNLLLAPPTRDNPNIWGGHRVWLGPQSSWSKIWPPPSEWELSGPESFTVQDGVLRLVMSDTRDGWPQIIRTYRWSGTKLICGVEMAGGNRPAQIIQIFQVPSTTVVDVQARPAAAFPAGYVRLPSMVSGFSTEFTQPGQVTRTGNDLTLRHTDVIEKLGFPPQSLKGHSGSYLLTVTCEGQTGQVVDEPDRGFFTQVYLGGGEALIELEQLSPLFKAGEPTSFTVGLEGTER